MVVVAGYLNDCFAGLGFAPTPGGQVDEVRETVNEKVHRTVDALAKIRVVVQGEPCRKFGNTPLRACDRCATRPAKDAEVEVEATAGAQRTVEALRGCLKRRGVKVHMVSE